MDEQAELLRIRGGVPLVGEIRVAGAKNAALPLMCASLLTEGTCSIRNIPQLTDITSCARLLSHVGADISINALSGDNGRYQDSLDICGANVRDVQAPYDIVSKMRASFLVLGPLLARFGKAKVSLPGGCAIGSRPVDIHMQALKALGAELHVEQGYVIASAKNNRLTGGHIHLPFPSVGATEHALLAATLADGETCIENAACEPEIVNLVDMLRAMGSLIEGEGTPVIRIQGRQDISGCDIAVIPDRIEAGSFLIAALMTGGDITLPNADPENCRIITDTLRAAGADITELESGGLRAKGSMDHILPLDIITQPHPGFPTDMQAQCMALLSLADGTSTVTENIFENRFMHVAEMVRAGADIVLETPQRAVVRGVKHLSAAELKATDLRASMSLVLMALAAEGESRIHHLHHIDRGYERVEEKLRAVGADITRIRRDTA